jgi:8-oxo-dGTP diphosphatase
LRPLRDEGRDLVRAVGAVLWREGPEFAVIHRPRYDDWSFPKGKLKSGEHPLRGVLREVEEETGVRARLGRRLEPTFYVKDGRAKRVDYWVATGAEAPFVPSDEVDALEWLTGAEAESRLTYERDVALLRDVLTGPRHTTPYLVLRHGSAGEKRDWLGDDTLRPLDPRGRLEAGVVARLLDGFGPLRVVSSGTARCVETVLPYAMHAGVSVITDRAFTNGVGDSATATARMLELIGDGTATLVCTHGELLTGMVSDLCARLGGDAPDDPALRKGAFWILHVADGVIVSMERH